MTLAVNNGYYRKIIMPKNNASISIVIPVYNNENSITMTIEKINSILESSFQNFEIIVVNDGSSDDTLLTLNKLQKIYPILKIISYTKNKGKGYAVRSGMKKTLGDIVVYIDGDFNVDPNVIKTYVEEIQDYDLLVASKSHTESIINVPSSRTFLSKSYNLFVRFFTGVEILDTQAGLKVGKGDVLRPIFDMMFIDRYAFDVELVTICTLLNKRIKEMPVKLKLDNRFKLKNIFFMFIDLMRIFYHYKLKN